MSHWILYLSMLSAGVWKVLRGNHSFKNHYNNHLHLLLYESRGESFVCLVRPNDKNVLGHHKDRYFNALFATPPNTFD